MVKVKENLVGRVFGRLTVLEQAEDYVSPTGQKKARWLCECSCEEHLRVVVQGSHLTARKYGIKSCGCLQRETMKEFNKTKKKINQYDLSGECGIGWTSNTDKEFYFDLEDYDKIRDYYWRESVDNTGYHYISSMIVNPDGSHTTVRIHNIVTGYMLCDHKDRNTFNNRKSNLREASYSENSQNRSLRSDNTSGITGVCWINRKNCWIAKLTLNGKTMYEQFFDNKESAIKARLRAELQYFGEFAPQRHLFEQYGITIQSDCEVTK